MMKTESAAAVVVTRNRLKLLQECLAALREQTRKPDAILVVDNDSSDGTAEWLTGQPDLVVVRQANLGSGGGQYAGMKAACERGHDWIWCMDDDGYPARECLERLLSIPDPTLQVRGVLALDRDNPDQLAFHYGAANMTRELSTKAEVLAHSPGGLLPDFATFFNGVLIHRDATARVGFPRPELFLWGDEIEYFHRIRAGGVRMVTHVGAEFFHPADRVKVYSGQFWGRTIRLRYVDDPFREYLLVRNDIYVTRRYLNCRVAVNRIIKYSIFRWRTGGAGRIPGVWRAGLAGLFGRLNGHWRFLKPSPAAR